MSKRVWFDRVLEFTHLDKVIGEGKPDGLVLSGGGSRASFHFGALGYLYEKCQISQTSIVATSAGSIAGAIIAQSLDPEVQYEKLRAVEDIWLAMMDPSEMFTEQTWFTKLQEQWGEISGVIPDTNDSEPLIFADTQHIDPEESVKQALDFDPSSEGGEFSLAMVWHLLGSLGRIGKVGAGLASTWRGAERAASAYRPGPLVHRLLFESGFNSQAVRESGVKLRLATVGLNSGELHFMREDGILVNTDDIPTRETPVDLTLGVWASCAIPGVFRPVRIGDELYVDGGVRENVPVEMGVTHLGMTKPYVIVSGPAGAAPTDFEAKDVVSILVRAMSILFDEAVQDEVAWARQAGAVVIDPLISVHGAMDVDHGLLKINRDYGWMRAAEVITSAEPGVTGPIVEARLNLWHELREKLDARAIRSARKTLRTLVDTADPALLPEGYEAWPNETWPAPETPKP